MNKEKTFESIIKYIVDSKEIIFDEIFNIDTSTIIVTISNPANKNTYKMINKFVKKN